MSQQPQSPNNPSPRTHIHVMYGGELVSVEINSLINPVYLTPVQIAEIQQKERAAKEAALAAKAAVLEATIVPRIAPPRITALPKLAAVSTTPVSAASTPSASATAAPASTSSASSSSIAAVSTAVAPVASAALPSTPPPVPHFASSSFAHQIAGHLDSSISFRSYRRRKTNDGVAHRGDITHSDGEEEVDVHESSVLKPIPHKMKGRREQKFYQEIEKLRMRLLEEECIVNHVPIFNSDDESEEEEDDDPSPLTPAEIEWLSFFPRYHGTMYQPRNITSHVVPTKQLVSLTSETSDESLLVPYYLHLEDLTASYTHPSLLDVKMGVASHDPFECLSASNPDGANKIERERSKCPSQSICGFRICGAKIWHAQEQTYEYRDKKWSRDIDMQHIDQPFWTYFGHRATKVPRRPTDATMRIVVTIVPLLLARLRQLLHLCLHAPKWRFYASSLLFCYEMQPTPKAQLHIIDFGHAYSIDEIPPTATQAPASSASTAPSAASSSKALFTVNETPQTDTNYIVGLRSLIGIFECMLLEANSVIGTASAVAAATFSTTTPTATSSATSSTSATSSSPPPSSSIPSSSTSSTTAIRTRTPQYHKLSYIFTTKFIPRKSFTALLVQLLDDTKTYQLDPYLRDLLLHLSYDLPLVMKNGMLHGWKDCKNLRQLYRVVTHSTFRTLLEWYHLKIDKDGRNTSFVVPPYTGFVSRRDGHPRTRRLRAKLKQKLELERIQKMQQEQLQQDLMRLKLNGGASNGHFHNNNNNNNNSSNNSNKKA